MRATIFCKTTEKGVHSFYINVGNESIFMFSQAYRKGVEAYFGRGVMIDEAVKYSKAHNDTAITKTMDKIPLYVRYVEKEYEIEILERTKKRYERNSYKARCA